jgi:hypothetical protein
MSFFLRSILCFIYIFCLLFLIQDNGLKGKRIENHELVSTENDMTNSIENWANKSLKLNSLRRLKSNINDDRDL